MNKRTKEFIQQKKIKQKERELIRYRTNLKKLQEKIKL